MQYVLNIIMNRHNLEVISVKTQYAVPNIYGRGVRFDVLAIDQYGRKYNFEVQNASSGAAPKRARYNINTLNSIKNLMKNTHWSAEKAMEAIGIPKSDFTRYLALL